MQNPNNHHGQGLRLSISNPTEVAGGVTTDHLFNARGGSIGTAENDTWRLSPHRTGAMAGHAEIRLVDGEFCLIDRSGRTYINSASLPVGRGRRARLRDGDVIGIGRYRLQTQLTTLDAAGEAGDEESDADLVLADTAETDLRRGSRARRWGEEPLTELQPAPAARVSDDPLQGMAPLRPQPRDEPASALLADLPGWRGKGREVSDEYRDYRDVAMGLPPTQGHRSMHRTPEPAVQDEDSSRRHIGGAPLLQGMEAELRFADSDAIRLFMEEAGQTLKATIDGLLALHRAEDARHQALRTRLQPIEDNPLRLGQDYQDAVQTLFASQRSPVHLSAPAAVSESLEGLRRHQQATQAAIREALDAILQAFSPQALLRRFHGYRRGLKSGEDEADWAWHMYEHYYRELSSSRQQGFERLFQEVFDQAYDHHLRQLQKEDLS